MHKAALAISVALFVIALLVVGRAVGMFPGETSPLPQEGHDTPASANELLGTFQGITRRLDDIDFSLKDLRERVSRVEQAQTAPNSPGAPDLTPPSGHGHAARMPEMARPETALSEEAERGILAPFQSVTPATGTVFFRDEMKLIDPWMLLHTLVPGDIDHALGVCLEYQLEVWETREGSLEPQARLAYLASARSYYRTITELERRADALREENREAAGRDPDAVARRKKLLGDLVSEVTQLRRALVTMEEKYLVYKPRNGRETPR